MLTPSRLTLAALLAALVTGCASQNPYDSQSQQSSGGMSKTAKYGGLGALAGAVAGAAINHDNRGKGALIGAAVAGAAGAGYGYYVDKQEEELRGLSDRLQGMRVQIEARVGEKGRLFGSVTSADIAEKLAAEVGEEIDRRKIDLEEPIRTVGEHQVTIRLVGRLQPTINVVVWDPENPHASVEDEVEASAEDTGEDVAEVEAAVDDGEAAVEADAFERRGAHGAEVLGDARGVVDPVDVVMQVVDRVVGRQRL